MDWPLHWSTATFAVFIVTFLYFCYTVVYNLYFHPLANFPGPKLAAVSRLYEFYYDLYLGGQFSDHLLRLHEKYGPIVRVTPFEVHIKDSSYYHNLFNFDNELDKRHYFMENLQNSASFELHRMRRRAFDPFFSRASVSKLEPMITDLVLRLCDRIAEKKEKNETINLSIWYRCLTCDIITNYSLGRSYEMMSDPDEHTGFIKSFCSAFKALLPIREISFIAWIAHNMEQLPDWLQFAPSGSSMAYMKVWQNGLEPRMRAIVTGKLDKTAHDHPVIMQDYMKNDFLGPEEKTYDRLRQTVQLFVGAGMETVGFSLSMTTYHMLTNSAILEKLRAEVENVWPNNSADLPSLSTLERLPYMTAVLRESMRLSVGVTSRLHRINHKRAMVYKDWVIPPGTSISMNQWFTLWDPEIFPEPEKFVPERWLQGEKSKDLEKWFVPFSRGSRGCIGERLAWAEMYLTLAAIVHRFDLKLFDTTEKNVMPKYDYFVSFPENKAGVRVLAQ